MVKNLLMVVLLAVPGLVRASEAVISYPSIGQPSIEALLAEVISHQVLTNKDRAFEVVHQALINYPRKVTSIVTTAMQADATTEDIARQCDMEISPEIIPDLVTAAIAQSANRQTIITRCLNSVPRDEAYLVLYAAMQSADPTEIRGVIAAAIQVFTSNGFDGSTILVNSLVEGEFLVFNDMPADCGADCIRPIAETLVNYLTNQEGVFTYVTDDLDEVESVIDNVEPSLSGS